MTTLPIITVEDEDTLADLPEGTVLRSFGEAYEGVSLFARAEGHTNGMGGAMFHVWENGPDFRPDSYPVALDYAELPALILNPEILGDFEPVESPNAEGTTVYITGNNTEEWEHSFEHGTEVEVVIDDTVLDGSLYVREADGNEDSVHNWVSVADVDVEPPAKAFQPGDVIRRKDDALPGFTFVVQADRLLSSCNGSPFRQATGWGLKQANTAFFEKVA